MPKNFGRRLRVAGSIHRGLATMLRESLRDPGLGGRTLQHLIVTEVEVSPDLSVADIYVSAGADGLEERQRIVAVLNHSAGYLRSRLAKGISLRITPRLRFHYDSSHEQGVYLCSLIDAAISQDVQSAHPQGAMTPSNEGES